MPRLLGFSRLEGNNVATSRNFSGLATDVVARPLVQVFRDGFECRGRHVRQQ